MSAPNPTRVSRAQPLPVPEILFVFGIIFLVAAGVTLVTLPGQAKLQIAVACVGVAMVLIAVVMEPKIITDRSSRMLVNDTVLVLSIVGIAVMLAYVGFRRHLRWDLTKNKLFSLTEQTTKIVGELKRDVQITAFFRRTSPVRALVEDFLAEYRRLAPDRLTVKMIDPFQEPMVARAMNISGDEVILVVCGNNRKEIFPGEIFTAPPPMGGVREDPKFHGEQALTSALINVTSDTRRKVVFVGGHDEPSIHGMNEQGVGVLQRLLDKDNFAVDEVNLLKTGHIATDVSVLAVVSPKKPFHEAEIAMIRDWIMSGKGRLLVTADPEDQLGAFGEMLASATGVSANTEMIINLNPALMRINPGVVIPDMQMHPTVKSLMEKRLGAFLMFCRGLVTEERPAWRSTVFLRTNDNTYAKRNLAEVLTTGRADFKEGEDVKGPFNLAVALEGQGVASGSRVVMVGDSDFVRNRSIQELANPDLAVNIISWLAGQEGTIAIRPRVFEMPKVSMTAEEANTVFSRVVIMPPILICVLGGLVYFFRRMV